VESEFGPARKVAALSAGEQTNVRHQIERVIAQEATLAHKTEVAFPYVMEQYLFRLV
jgi:hypothetical protein